MLSCLKEGIARDSQAEGRFGIQRSGRSLLRRSGVPLHPRSLGQHSTHTRHWLHAGFGDCCRPRARAGASSSHSAGAHLPHQSVGSGICRRPGNQPGASLSPLVDGESVSAVAPFVDALLSPLQQEQACDNPANDTPLPQNARRPPCQARGFAYEATRDRSLA